MSQRRDLIDLASLGRDGIGELIDHARCIRTSPPSTLRGRLAGREIVHLFLEPSTRTKISFKIAARRLGAEVVDFDGESSSLQKGESLFDTVRTIEAMGTDALIVRHREDGTAAGIAAVARGPIICAGEGVTAHPTQGLLDLLTLLDEFDSLAGRRIAIVGDIRHSRVARSDVEAFVASGAEVVCVAPRELHPEVLSEGTRFEEELEPLLPSLDAVILLRVQKERFAPDRPIDLERFVERYQFTAERLAATPPHCVVLHPGPLNRGVELTDAVADGPRSRVLKQVENGVAVRMAVLEWCLGETW